MKKNLMVGMGENAGVVDVGEGWAVTFKIESHNHPSYIEPFQGAATGVGGIVRDIISMGARPVAVMDALRFGDIDDPDTARVVHGVVSRHLVLRQLPRPAEHRRRDLVRLGVPGATRSSTRSRSACCATKTCTSPTPAAWATRSCCSAPAPAATASAGHPSSPPTRSRRAARPSARPCRSATRSPRRCSSSAASSCSRGDLVEGIQDLGAAGISCATCELASQRRRRHVHRAREGAAARPHAHGRGDPHVGEPGAHDGDRHAREARGLPRGRPRSGMSRPACSARSPTPAASSSTGTARRSSTSSRARSPSTAPSTTAPSPTRRWIDALQADTAAALCRARPTATSCATSSCALLGSPEPRRQVAGSPTSTTATCSATPRCASPTTAAWCASTRRSGLGFAVATDANGRYCQLDPYRGAQLALAEAYRNVAATGATPVAVSDCLNFGSPENPEVMWQFSQAVEGLADGCLELEIPVTGGNVSFYNQTGDVPIHPTPVVAVLGVIDDVAARIPSRLAGRGQQHLPARHHAARARRLGLGRRHPRPPRRSPARRRPRRESAARRPASPRARSESLIASAHDLADGGLAQALAEAVLRFGVGARVWLDEIMRARRRRRRDGALQRVDRPRARQRAARRRREVPGAVRGPRLPGAPHRRDRATEPASRIQDQFDVSLDELRGTHRGHPAAALRRRRRRTDGEVLTHPARRSHGEFSPSSRADSNASLKRQRQARIQHGGSRWHKGSTAPTRIS